MRAKSPGFRESSCGKLKKTGARIFPLRLPVYNGAMKRTDAASRFYITAKTFLSNDLSSYACACAFNFFLSSVPLALLVVSVCLRIWQSSGTEILHFLSEWNALYGSFPLLETVQPQALPFRASGLVEALALFSVLWLSRKVFLSTQQAFKRIYRRTNRRRALRETLLVVAAEVAIVLSITLVILVITAVRTLLNLDFFRGILPAVLQNFLHRLFLLAPAALLFGFLFLLYQILPLPRPKAGLSALCALLCTASFSVFSAVFSLLIDPVRYNLIYGLAGNLVLFLIKVYLFFVFLLFFAQFQNVSQFYENFLLAGLYLLSQKTKSRPDRRLETRIFLNSAKLQKYKTVFPAGTPVFTCGENSHEIYCICSGIIRTERGGVQRRLEAGQTFGDFAYLAGIPRTASAVAETDCVLLKIPPEVFRKTLDTVSGVARRNLQVTAEHIGGMFRSTTGDSAAGSSSGTYTDSGTSGAEIEKNRDL